MRLFRLLVAHPGLKLFSLVLAWGLWYAVREDLDETRTVTLRVEADPGSDAGVDGQVLTDSVEVRIKGSRREVELLANGLRPLRAPIASGDLAVDQYSGTKAFRASELRFPAPVAANAVRIVEMEPQKVDVRVRRIQQRDLPLAPPIFPPAEETRVRIETRKLPERVWVRAPAEHLRTLIDVKTVVDREQLLGLISRMDDSVRTTATVQLHIDASQADLLELIEPRTLEAVIELVRVDEQTIVVPLVVLQPRGQDSVTMTVAAQNKPWVFVGPEPAVNLTLRGSRENLAAVDSRRIRAFLLATDLPPEGNLADIPVHVADLPQGVALDRTDYTVTVEFAR